jgi:hypothetical protein
MSKSLENYEAEVYAEIKRNYDKAVRSGTPASRAARNANYRRSTAKTVATRRMSANQKRIRKGKLPRTSWSNSNTNGNTNGNTSGNNSNANSTGATRNNNGNGNRNRRKSLTKNTKRISWRANVKPPAPAPAPLPMMNCTRCSTRLQPPSGAPIFACPCGQQMYAPKPLPPPPPPPPPVPVATPDPEQVKSTIENYVKRGEEMRKEIMRNKSIVERDESYLESELRKYNSNEVVLSSKPVFKSTGTRMRSEEEAKLAKAYRELYDSRQKLIELIINYRSLIIEHYKYKEIYAPTNATMSVGLPKMLSISKFLEEQITEYQSKQSHLYKKYCEKTQTSSALLERSKEECTISG